MSLALRGDQDAARQALTPLVADSSSATSEAYLAAFYLAQLGDPSGYPAMVRALHSKSEHTRLMAARHLIAFKPYEGQTVGDRRVDVRAELAERLKDPSVYVRREIPYLLAEASVRDLKELLTPVAADDAEADVRQAAADVVGSLKDK
jgi:HEAT repeat protein